MYGQAIAAAIGNNDLATIKLVEDLMRADRSGLDGMSRAEFTAAARAALADAAALAAAGLLREYCAAAGLTVPARFGGAR